MKSNKFNANRKMSKKEMLDYFPGFRHMDDITEIASQYFKGLNLKYFGHISVWPEGKYSILCNKHDWPIEFVHKGLPPVGFSIYEKMTDRVIFPSMDKGNILGISDEMTALAKERFNILNPMVVVRKYEDHYEAFAFDIHCENVYDTYINNFELFEIFIHYYKDRAKKIIEAANQRCVIIDSQYLPSNTKEIELCTNDEKCVLLHQLKKYYLRHKGADIIVSGKEYYCLCLLAHGKQLKSIANELGVSLRTVETYLDRIKAKLNLTNRDELVAVYWDNKIFP
jgi:DNA-binding CsgD family transcriptional regulator